MAQRVLVIQLARFGDLVQTKRLAGSAAGSPEGGAELHLAVDAALASLARLVYPHAIVHPVAAHGNMSAAQALALNRRAFAELAAQRFDAVYNLNFSGMNLALARLFDPEAVRGHASHGPQAVKDPWVELAFRWGRMRRNAGLNLVDFWAHLAPRPMDPQHVNPPATPRGGGLGVVLAGRQQRRSLPPDVLARMAQTLWGLGGRRSITLLGTAAELSAAKELTVLLPAGVRVVNLCGRTDWAGLADAVAGLDRVLTPDTGTMHLAAHLGVPVTATFLSSAWCWETGPYGEGHTVWQAAADCAPCLESAACGGNMACLEPLAHPGFPRLLAGGQGQSVPGVIGLSSGFDALGAVYRAQAGATPGNVPGQAERDAFRAFLCRHLNVADAPLTGLAEAYYMERDWMLRRKPQVELHQ